MRPLRDPSLGVPMDLAEDELAAIREDAAAWREFEADELASYTDPRFPRRLYAVAAAASEQLHAERIQHFMATGESEIVAPSPRLRRLLALKFRMLEFYGRTKV